MIKLLNNNVLELCPHCGQNYERMRSQFGQVLIMSKSTQLKAPSNSRGVGPKWSNLTTLNAVFINKGMPQQDRLIELNKIAIHQMKVLEGVEGRRMLK